MVVAMQDADQHIRSSLGFSICPRTRQHAEQGNQTSNLPISSRWLSVHSFTRHWFPFAWLPLYWMGNSNLLDRARLKQWLSTLRLANEIRARKRWITEKRRSCRYSSYAEAVWIKASIKCSMLRTRGEAHRVDPGLCLCDVVCECCTA